MNAYLEFKKKKFILLPHLTLSSSFVLGGVGLKSCPIPAPLPLRDRENLRGVKRGEAGRGKITIPKWDP